MRFRHSPDIWMRFPTLAALTLPVSGVHVDLEVSPVMEPFLDAARTRLAGVASESDLPEIKAWRRAFAEMGLKPTQYRCAAEALLRRFRKDDALPRVHPLVDLCNAVSIAYATPIAVFDLDHIDGDLIVRLATGDETYEAFNGDIEHPAASEVIFADSQQRAHARRWTNRQAATSAVRPGTARVLIVAEALHPTALADTRALGEDLRAAMSVLSLEPHPIEHLSSTEPASTV